MPDSHTPEQRRYNMSRIRSSGTTPEIRLGNLLRLMFPDAVIDERRADLPGKPDFYLPGLHLAVFADGCFFHRCPKHFIMPQNNQEYWASKITRNRQRDHENNRKLKAQGITPVRIWEHNLGRDLANARRQIRRAIRTAKKSETSMTAPEIGAVSN
jgi:DNA mismatch endonuclease, patch repair protein